VGVCQGREYREIGKRGRGKREAMEINENGGFAQSERARIGEGETTSRKRINMMPREDPGVY